MSDDRLSLQSLVENALGYRFVENEDWQNPEFLRQKFSNEDLSRAIRSLSRTNRLRRPPNESGINSDTITKAKELLESTKEITPPMQKLRESLNNEENQIIAENSGTPETFYYELQKENYYRDFLKKRENHSKNGERGI